MHKRNGQATSETKMLGDLTQLLANARLKDLKWRHDVGKCIWKLCPERGYGQDYIGNLREKLPKPGWSVAELRKMRDFAVQYSDEQVDALLAAAKNDFRFTWSHVCCLLRLEIKERERLQRDCRRRGWSYERLLVEIRSMPEKRSQGGRKRASPAALAEASTSKETRAQSKGRKYALPKTMDDALSQLMRETSDWQKRYRKVWFEGEAILGDNFERQSLSDPQLLDHAIQCIKELSENVQQAEKRLAAGCNGCEPGDAQTPPIRQW